MTTLADALTDALVGGRAAALIALGREGDRDLPLPELPSALADFLRGVATASPFLERTMRRRDLGALLRRGADLPPARLVPEPGAMPLPELRKALREAKADASLLVALADLSGLWDMTRATEALSDVADACVELALRAAWEEAAALRKADIRLPAAGPVPGLAVVAMGKLGSRTLNYSSDIDLVVVYDGDALPTGPDDALGPRALATRVTQNLLAILSDQTADGYVFRTDLRLRPDPSSSALAVSVARAERYYEEQGQNWERLAYIKARACAGDRELATGYLAMLRPFVWRRTLDYAALADVRAVGQQIQARAGSPDLAVPGADVKLGPGGIREAEFFCEVQQLVFGGQDEALRTARTLDTLGALSAKGRVPRETADALADAYTVLRDVEDRLQMVHDQPDRTVPEDDGDRARLSVLYGETDLARFDDRLLGALGTVHEAYAELFGTEASDVAGSLVFTGVDDDPRTLRTLAEMGFSNPAAIAATVRGWHQGRLAAARSVRVRELLTALVPRVLKACATTGNADEAFAAFSQLLAILPGAQGLFGLFTAQPALLGDVITLCAASPSLTRQMGRRPSLVQALIAGEDVAPPPPPAAELEAEMDAMRGFAQRARLRAAAELTLGRGDPYEAGRVLASLAEACVERLFAAVRSDMDDPGPPLAVLAFGRFGAGAMTTASDLDLVFAYEGGPEAAPIALRRVRRLVAALSAPTARGVLYEVDMKLRPSGGAGPAAVGLAAFERYYRETARTWELMALTKARVVCAEGGLGERLAAATDEVLARPAPAELSAEAAAMRRRLLQGHPPRGPFDVKRLDGGLTDIDFVAQVLTLRAGGGTPRDTPSALRAHREAGRLGARDAEVLLSAHALLEGVAQYARATFGTVPMGGLTAAQEGAMARLCRTAPPLEPQVAAAADAVRSVSSRLIG